MASYSLGNEFIPKARAAALRALDLDEQLAEAHTSLALIVQNHDWDWPKAEQEYRRAIQLDPNYATAHHWYGEFLGFQGRFDEAFASSTARDSSIRCRWSSPATAGSFCTMRGSTIVRSSSSGRCSPSSPTSRERTRSWLR
jgi:hypothetical protein